MNQVILFGRLTADPEVRYTQTGKVVTSFTLAIDRPKAKDAEKAETDFIRCQAWGTLGENIGNHFNKGKRMLCYGSIRTGSYDKDGKKVYTFDINVKGFHFIESKTKNEDGQTSTTNYEDMAQNNPAFKQPTQTDFGSFGSFEEEIPF